MTQQELKNKELKNNIWSLGANSTRVGTASKHGAQAIMFLALMALVAGCNKSEESSASERFDRSTQDKNATAQEMKKPTPNSGVQADNSRMNAMGRESSEPTADQAKNNLSDRETMQLIRKSIVADKSLSVYGHNVKVIAQNGHVTLNGTVHTQEEKSNIAAKAGEVAGRGNVTNKIKIDGL